MKGGDILDLGIKQLIQSFEKEKEELKRLVEEYGKLTQQLK